MASVAEQMRSSMGASAVLLFAAPASPLAQPWSIIGANLVSSLAGITCDMDEYRTMGRKFRHFTSKTLHARPSKLEIVGQIMTQHVKMVTDTTLIIEPVPLMANSGLHHIPVVDAENRFAGIVTQSDMGRCAL
jgi:CBS-domain-containing membrane protein